MNIIKKFFHKNSNTKKMEILFKTNARGGKSSTLKSNQIRISRSTIALNSESVEKHGIKRGWYGALGSHDSHTLCFAASLEHRPGFARITSAGKSKGKTIGHIINIPKIYRNETEEFTGDYEITKTITTGDYIEFMLKKIND